MLKLKNICKTYDINKQKKIILDNVNIDFKDKGLVFILGASGSGKSTLLNIIGGNLKCSSGKIYLGNICITDLKYKELDNYRQNVVSTIFQDYNLIESLNVIDNIMLGCHKKNNKNELIVLLKQLNLYDKRNISINKLSGGEKQRVAIARALVGNSKIILADEPTGALDSKTSIEIMELFKRISQDKLVIIVTHNIALANKYADRIITIKDGKCKNHKIKDDNQTFVALNNKYLHLNNTLKLALKALKNKPLRTIFTALAIAIGLFSIILVTNIYSNFNYELNELEKRIVTIFPITIKNGEYEIASKEGLNQIDTNKISNEFVKYLQDINQINNLTFNYDILLPIISDNYQLLSIDYLEVMPDNNNYIVTYGNSIKNKYDVLLKVTNNDSIDKHLINVLNINETTNYKDIIGKKLKVILNDQYFIKQDNYYFANENNQELYNNGTIELTIVGIIKEKELVNNKSTIMYSQELIDSILNENKNSNLVKDLLNNNYKVLGVNNDKTTLLSYLGYNTAPTSINIYVANMENKQAVLEKIDKYNLNGEKIVYIDNMTSSINVVRKFISIISLILIIFSLLALITSSIMIGILTSINVLERTKDIGILKSLGYSRKDISHLFNLENILIGIFGFVISIIIIILIVEPGNKIINNYIGINNLLNLNYKYLSIIFILNILLIKLVSSIPIMNAAKLDTVTCIYGK